MGGTGIEGMDPGVRRRDDGLLAYDAGQPTLH